MAPGARSALDAHHKAAAGRGRAILALVAAATVLCSVSSVRNLAGVVAQQRGVVSGGDGGGSAAGWMAAGGGAGQGPARRRELPEAQVFSGDAGRAGLLHHVHCCLHSC
jgi:hypothetical protein